MKAATTLILLMILSVNLISQTGPGGVGTATNNVLWLKADAGTSTISDGAAVSSWNDQSGNGIHVSQGTAVQRPVYKSSLMNGMPAIEFDNNNTSGHNDFLTAPDNAVLDNTNGYTAFSVVRMKNLDGDARCIFSKRTSIDTDEAFMFFFHTSNTLNLDIDGLGDRFSTSHAYATHTNYLVGFNYDGTLASASRSRILDGDSIRKTGAETSATVSDKASPLVIGATHIGDNRPFSGYISEIILFRKALGMAEQTIVYNYLSAKYDIALLKNDKYTGDDAARGNYDYDVAGIGKESGIANSTFDASASKGLKLTAMSGLDNGDYAMIGNKSVANWQNTTDVGGMTGTNNARWERTWYIDVTNTSTPLTLDLEFDFSDGGIAGSPGTAGNYVLLFRPGNSGNWTEVATANATPGDRVKFNNYTLTIDGYYTIGTRNFSAGTLPVSLLSFNAEQNKSEVALSWETASETNNSFFTIERSSDAFNYETIATVKSKAVNGNSVTHLQYEFADAEPLSGTNYYRLTQTDLNGAHKTFAPVSLVMEPERNVEFTLYPNPNKGSFQVRFSGIQNEQQVTVDVLTVDGKKIYDTSYARGSAEGSFPVDLPELKSGFYTVFITAGDTRYPVKMLVE